MDWSSFEAHGYVTIPKAFPRESALAMEDFIWTKLNQLNGMDRSDPNTWKRRLKGLNQHAKAPIFKHIASPALCGAIDCALGAGLWKVPDSWGPFLVTFPSGSAETWQVPDKLWHWDDNPECDLADMQRILVFTFISHVRPCGGGPLAVAGSHHLVKRFFNRLTNQDLMCKQPVLIRQFSRSHQWLSRLTGKDREGVADRSKFMNEWVEVHGVPVRVVELTGEPGDAVICHPMLFHASAPNHRKTPRFMRRKCIRKNRTLTFGASKQGR